jgi:hypothetical protein
MFVQKSCSSLRKPTSPKGDSEKKRSRVSSQFSTAASTNLFRYHSSGQPYEMAHTARRTLDVLNCTGTVILHGYGHCAVQRHSHLWNQSESRANVLSKQFQRTHGLGPCSQGTARIPGFTWEKPRTEAIEQA